MATKHHPNDPVIGDNSLDGVPMGISGDQRNAVAVPTAGRTEALVANALEAYEGHLLRGVIEALTRYADALEAKGASPTMCATARGAISVVQMIAEDAGEVRRAS